METQIRHRLTALEEQARQALSLSTALAAVVSALPETKSLNKNHVLSLLRTLAQDSQNPGSLLTGAEKHVDRLLG